MLSVSKLSPGQEAYYERSVAAGIDDYYAGRGESPGVWVGRGAAELELEGVVGEGELGRLIGGRHPLSSAVLRSHPPKKQITVERIDPATGERRLEEKTLSPVAGYDLVFSPPKSVSLLHALGSEEVRHAVDQAHLAAWQAALAYLEQEACVTRRGKNGVVRERGSGFVAAAYQHRTSRAQDPHLHTHVIVANMTKTPSDGEWRALDGEPILKQYRLAAGYLYQSQLRFELTRSLGVEWRQPENGMAEIAGVPDGGAAGVLAAAGAGARLPRAARQLGLLRRQGRRAPDPRPQGAARPAPPAPGVGGARSRARPRPPRAQAGARPRARARVRRARRRRGHGATRWAGWLDREALDVQRHGGGDGLGAGAHPGRPGRARALARRALSRDRAGGADRSRGGRAAGRLLDRRAAAPRAGGAGARRARPPGSRPGCLGGDGRAGRRRPRADARPRAGGDAASGRLEP